jgi:hypothetical protein
MPTIRVDLEHDIYINLVRSGVDIEKEFKKFLLQNRVLTRFKESRPFPNYWDVLDAEIETIKMLNNKIFYKH